MDVIAVKDVWKVYGEEVKTYALRGVTLSVKKGEYIAIMGPSGSGKSTLMHIMGLLDVPTKGEVLIKGRNAGAMGEEERAMVRRETVGFVFQQFNLSPSLTALENVELPMVFAGVPEEERRERAQELLEAVGLRGKENSYPNQLSGGQQQRVAIARALANDPEIILADEPTGNLDTASGRKVMELLERLNESGKTLIMVTHDPTIGKRAERIYWIKDGKIQGVEEHA